MRVEWRTRAIATVCFAVMFLVAPARLAGAEVPERPIGPTLGIKDPNVGKRPVLPKRPTKAELGKKQTELEKKQKALQAKLDARAKKFLESKDGKRARQKQAEVDKEAGKKKAAAIDERNRKQGANCCGLAERSKWGMWLQDRFNEIDDETDAKNRKIVEDEMKTRDKSGYKQYRADQRELDKAKAESQKIDRLLDEMKAPIVEP